MQDTYFLAKGRGSRIFHFCMYRPISIWGMKNISVFPSFMFVCVLVQKLFLNIIKYFISSIIHFPRMCIFLPLMKLKSCFLNYFLNISSDYALDKIKPYICLLQHISLCIIWNESHMIANVCRIWRRRNFCCTPPFRKLTASLYCILSKSN